MRGDQRKYDRAQVAMEVYPLCPHINPMTTSARMDTSGCRLPLSLRGSLSSANIFIKWQDFLLVIYVF